MGKHRKCSQLIFTLIILSGILTGCKTSQHMINSDNVKVHAFRLKPGQDLRIAIDTYVKENNITAGWISTCAGSLTNYNIRFANQETGTIGNGYFEIVSLTGTLSVNGSHIHISISDSTGAATGGHLLKGCTIYTTAEIVILSTTALNFSRAKDGTTPWEELHIEKAGNK